WPDFMTFYGTPATGAGWIVPKKYVEKVGDDGFKRAPVGAGPYRFVSFNPGVELVLEAFEGYWRKTPSVKRLVFKSVTEEETRLAANHAIDGPAINKAETLGFSKITGSIIPATFEFFWSPPVHAYDLARTKRLLAEAGYPNGFDAGDYYFDASYANLGEAVVNYLKAAGIRTQLRPLERVAFIANNREKKLKNIIQ